MNKELKLIVEEIKDKLPENGNVVFVSGNFNIIHPGHLRLLNFAAECGDHLVVGVLGDNNGSSLLKEEFRLEGVESIGVVDFAFILYHPPEEFIDMLRPAFVVKGKEHELRDNNEFAVLESYGGKLLFSSGEVRFSSLDLLQRDILETDFSPIHKPSVFLKRHNFKFNDLVSLIKRFNEIHVVVVGDLIVDDYVNCEPLGMSQEDSTIVVTPIKNDRFIGGAGIVAAHTKGLGANVSYFCVTGDDEIAEFAANKIQGHGVDYYFIVDKTRPTTLKQRFRAKGRSLLRVNHLRQHDISHEIADKIYDQMVEKLNDADVLIFSDFSYGCLTKRLIDQLIDYCHQNDIAMTADSQASSQMGDITRFKGMSLITPTEYEARLGIRDFSSGLAVISQKLHKLNNSKHVIVTLGSEGSLIQTPNTNDTGFETDRLPAFNTAPKDNSGAGDSLLACASLTLAAGADIWQSAYLGSIAAACQVSRLGNNPLTAAELITEIME